MQEFVVNESITLKMENGKTIIYLVGKRFRQCKSLFLNIPKEIIHEFEDINSIDKAFNHLDETLEHSNPYEYDISPEEEFRGHCSNLQVWAENNYDTRLLHSTLAFPLLKRLSEINDSQARRVYKKEILKRIESREISVINFILNNQYLESFDNEELKILYQELRTFINIYFRGKQKFNFDMIEIDFLRIINELSDFMKRKDFFEVFLENSEANTLTHLESKIGKMKLIIDHENMFESLSNYSKFNAFSIKNGFVNTLIIYNSDLKQLPQEITKLSKLKKLYLIGSGGLKVPDSIGNLKSLEFLDLSSNQIKEIPEAIGQLESLIYLRLDNNYLSYLPNNIVLLKSIRLLDLGVNLLSALPDSFDKLHNLETLYLNDNKFKSIPKIILNCKNLELVYLNGNYIENVPDMFKKIKKIIL